MRLRRFVQILSEVFHALAHEVLMETEKPALEISVTHAVCSAYHQAIPLRNVPLVAYKTAECLDEYWKDIAELGSSASAILHFPASTWMPCMKLSRDSNSDAYVAVSGRKSQFLNMVKYFINQIDQAIETYGDLFNGIYIHNLGNEGFFVPYLPSVVGYVTYHM